MSEQAACGEQIDVANLPPEAMVKIEEARSITYDGLGIAWRPVFLVLSSILAILPSDVRGADCGEFVTLIQQGSISEVERGLLGSRTDKACAYHLAVEYLQQRKLAEAVKWINFARLFVNHDRDPRLYPLILYHMLLLDPYPREDRADFPAPVEYDAERDYNALLGYGGDQIKELSADARVAFIPEMRSFVKRPWDRSCPEKSVWVDRLYLDWSEAQEVCNRITVYEVVTGERFNDPEQAEETLVQLRELGVNADWVVEAFRKVEPDPTVVADSRDEETAGPPRISPTPRRASGKEETEPQMPVLEVGTGDRFSLKSEAIEILSFVDVPSGSFDMGCTSGDAQCTGREIPFTRVKISRPYRLAAYETTNKAFRKCVEAGVCDRPEGSKAYGDPVMDDHPVVYVGWEQAKEFCEWLGGRLPTEAEWELAARGTHRGYRYPKGNSISHTDANYAGTKGRDRWDGTSPVGSFPPNSRGLYDMTGNVREWVADGFESYSEGEVTDRQGNPSSPLKVTRGGGWNQRGADLRVSARIAAGAPAQSKSLGFRCLLPPSKKESR